MKVIQVILALASAAALSNSASAVPDGVSFQIGAQAVVCRNQSREVTSAELLDLYEARIQYGRSLTQWDPAKDYHAIAHDVAGNIDQGSIFFPSVYEPLYENGGRSVTLRKSADTLLQVVVDMFQENHDYNTILAPGAGLNLTPDFQTILVPSQCAIEQAATSLGTGEQTYFTADIWDHFDQINKAALVIHQSLNWAMHVGGYRNSDRTRRIVGLAFSDFKFQDITDGIPDRSLFCFSEGKNPLFQFDVYKAADGKVTMQFFTFNGIASATKTTITTDAQSTPLADGRKRVQPIYGITWHPPTDVAMRTILEPKNSTKGKVEYWIGADIVGQDSFNNLVKVKCSPATFDHEQN